MHWILLHRLFWLPLLWKDLNRTQASSLHTCVFKVKLKVIELRNPKMFDVLLNSMIFKIYYFTLATCSCLWPAWKTRGPLSSMGLSVSGVRGGCFWETLQDCWNVGQGSPSLPYPRPCKPGMHWTDRIWRRGWDAFPPPSQTQQTQ